MHSWNPPFINGDKGLSFRNFHKKGGSDFSHKNEGAGTIEVVFKKGVSLIFIFTNPF